MKNRYIPYIISSILIGVFLLIFIVLQNNGLKNIEVDTNKSSKKIYASNNFEKPVKYTLKASNNEIYLYNNKNSIIKRIDINFELLRDYDKSQFKKGIVVSSLEEVFQIIEDFSS